MLAANTSAADLIIRSKRQGLFRVHEGPTPEKLSALREFLKLQGLRLAGGEDPSPADYARLSREMKQRPDYKLLQTLLLRSMQQAIYSPVESVRDWRAGQLAGHGPPRRSNRACRPRTDPADARLHERPGA